MAKSALNAARSFLLSFLQIDNLTVGKHPLVKEFSRGTCSMRLSLPKYRFTWNVGIVTKFLLDYDNSSSMLSISMKVATLPAFFNGQRAREMLSVIVIKNINLEESCCIVRIANLLKISNANHRQGKLKFLEYKHKPKNCLA